MSISSALTRRWSLIALIALLGLAVTVATTSSSGASSGHAVAAKKKCKKKKGKKSATAAKKKKCKRKKQQQPQQPQQPQSPPSSPSAVVRASLSWTSDNDVDLHVFDSSGNDAGYGSGGEIENTIPNSSFSGDVQTAGSESFTDNIFVVGGSTNREFGYVACLWDVESDSDYSVTFSAVSKDGSTVTRTLQGTPSDGSDAFAIPMPGGPTVPDPEEICDFTV
jgi:hypothetical protein